MDVKAMAKSKRSHSQHHSKKSYPKPNAKATVDAADTNKDGNVKRPSAKNVVEKKVYQSRGAELPSNSDRYYDEDDLNSNELLRDGSLRDRTDVVKPKSKGADYRYLISEARSQTHSTDHMDVYSSLDDIMLDLNQGFGDLLAVRGEAILSWTAADYFIVEDKTRPSYEASFLSLNLNTLNEQLARVDLAQRLFIEPDALPPELRPHKSEVKDAEQEQFQNSFENNASKADPGVTEFAQPPFKDESVLKEVVVTSSEVGDNDDNDVNEASVSGLKLKSQDKDTILDDSSKRLPNFEPSQAEAELDLLLNSLGETDGPLTYQIPSVQPQFLTAIQTSTTVPGYDDTFDDLLSSNPSLKETVSALDGGIDDLLDSTSYMTIHDNTLKSSKEVTAPVDDFDTTLNSKAKLAEDFDSWLDTL